MATDLIGEVADYLIAQGMPNVRSAVEWPTTPVFFMLVLEDTSRAPQGFFTADEEIRYIGFSVLVRGEQSSQARTRALAVYDLLRYYAPLGCRAVGQPLPIGTDGDGNPLYEVSFEAKLKE